MTGVITSCLKRLQTERARLVLYVFGVLGLELIAVNPRFQSDPAANAVIRENFSSLGMSMITLTQFITMDNISAIYLPMVKLEPAIFVFFAVLILIVSVSVTDSVVPEASSKTGGAQTPAKSDLS